MNNIWKILGIEPTTDTRAIKKAYAAQVKNCHQEDEPERWQELHEAYKQALEVAENGHVPVRKTVKRKSEPKSDVNVEKKESTTPKTAATPEKKKEPEKKAPKEVQKEVRKVKLELPEDAEENKTVEEQDPVEEKNTSKEYEQYNELFGKITDEQRIDERREHILKNLYKLISMPPEGHCVSFKRFLDNPKLRHTFEELAFWQAMSGFLRKASTTSEAYDCITKKIAELLSDEERTFSEDVIAEMQAAQTLSQVKCREAKHREKKASVAGKMAFKRDIRGRVLQLLGLIILMIFILLVFGDGSPEDWGRFIVRLLRTIVRIL